MSIAFSRVKNSNTLGLDDQLTFGRHIGYTVLEVLRDRPDYIEYLIAKGKKFYPSVNEELNRRRSEAILSNTKKYLIQGYGWNRFTHQEDYWDDVPF